MHFNRWGIIEKHVKLHYGQSGLVIENLENFLPAALGVVCNGGLLTSLTVSILVYTVQKTC
jgi:hypothetical protein